MKLSFNHLVFISLLFLVASCARRGSITGGPKDTLAPVLKNSIPKNFSTQFTGKEIQLTFDEYVKLKNVNKQLVISPPLEKEPEILPFTPSKTISIRFKDDLKPNTTYSLNFGQSIEDNNESNSLQNFKYVFSTGSTIDSLKLKVKLADALEQKTPTYVSVMLYEIDADYSDSIIYKKTPNYLANSLDTLTTVELTNLKEGKYRLIAIKDENRNNKFDPKTEKIAFETNVINIPSNDLPKLNLFKEVLPFAVQNANQSSGNKIIVGYQGDVKKVKITARNNQKEIPIKVSKFPQKDSLQVWFKANKNDSLTLEIAQNKYLKKYSFKIKDQKQDTLAVRSDINGVLPFRETFSVVSSTPLKNWDESKILFTKGDKSVVKYKLDYDEEHQKLNFLFDKEANQGYTITMLPKALTDYFDKPNDSLTYKFKVPNSTDFGNLKVILENVKHYPVIVQLTDKQGKVLAEEFAEKSNQVNFEFLQPNKFTMRVIYDGNKNKKWDAGNYLQKTQSEEVLYFPKELDVRANWDVEQVFDLKNTN